MGLGDVIYVKGCHNLDGLGGIVWCGEVWDLIGWVIGRMGCDGGLG
jgi:hypothetical protein